MATTVTSLYDTQGDFILDESFKLFWGLKTFQLTNKDKNTDSSNEVNVFDDAFRVQIFERKLICLLSPYLLSSC